MSVEFQLKEDDVVFVPGRATLLGEHQDYLGLPVVPTPINAGLSFTITPSERKGIIIDSYYFGLSPVFDSKEKLELKNDSWDLARAVLKIYLSRFEDYLLEDKFIIEVNGTLPPSSGLSSSAAFSVGLLKVLLKMREIDIPPAALAELAYEAEHDILGVPCGKMDQYSVAFADTLVMNFEPFFDVEQLGMTFPIIPVYSGKPKNTQQVHGPLQEKLKKTLNMIFGNDDFKVLHTITEEEVEEFKYHELKDMEDEWRLLKGYVGIRDTTKEGIEIIRQTPWELKKIGDLMTKQHIFLSDFLKVSTPELDKIVWLGLEEGALGGKLTGSGKGGSAILLTTEEMKNKVRTAIEKEFKVI